MSIYNKFISGKTIEAHSDILKLGEDAFRKEYIKDIEQVLTETFKRVRHNLEIIYSELENIGYEFYNDTEYSSFRPLTNPLSNVDDLLMHLDSAIKPFGQIPLALQFFYKIVGSVNFCWNYHDNGELIWSLSDPICISSLDDVVDEVSTDDWKEYIGDYIKEEGLDYAFIDLAPDEYHKDDISGGAPYAIKVSKRRCVDNDFLYEPNNTSFINYLRICLDSCGFPGLIRNKNENSQDFLNKVSPMLKKI